MSTKIYTGIIFTTNDVYEIHQTLLGLREEACRLGNIKKFTERVELTTRIVDKKLVFNHFGEVDPDEDLIIENGIVINQKGTYDKTAYGYACDIIDKDIREEQKRDQHSFYDIYLDFAIFPMKDKVLGMYFSNYENMYHKLIMNCPIIKDYHYQDSSDKPSKITNKEWGQRKEDWDIALKDIGISTHWGLMCKIVDGLLLDFARHDGLKLKWKTLLPTFENRIKHATRMYLTDKWTKESKEEKPFDKYCEADRRYRDEAEKNSDTIIKTREEVMKILPDNKLFRKQYLPK